MEFSLDTLEQHIVAVRDPRVAVLLEDLARDYEQRYGEGGITEMSSYPDEQFEAPDGKFVILQHAGQTVAGGAYRKYDEQTAELKRIWTHPDYRRRGLGIKLLEVLEDEAAGHGYRKLFLVTGPMQPEAIAMYARHGYEPLFDMSADLAQLHELAFAKPLPQAAATGSVQP